MNGLQRKRDLKCKVKLTCHGDSGWSSVLIRRGTCGFDRSYKHEEEKNAESLLAEFHGRSTLLLEQGLDGSYAAGAHGVVEQEGCRPHGQNKYPLAIRLQRNKQKFHAKIWVHAMYDRE